MCPYLHKSSSVAVNTGATAVVITFRDNPTNIADMQRFCFCVQQAVPTAGLALPVELTINGISVPLWNKYGDVVTGSDIVTRYVNKGWYGTDNDTHVITTSLPKECYKCPNACY